MDWNIESGQIKNKHLILFCVIPLGYDQLCLIFSWVSINLLCCRLFCAALGTSSSVSKVSSDSNEHTKETSRRGAQVLPAPPTSTTGPSYWRTKFQKPIARATSFIIQPGPGLTLLIVLTCFSDAQLFVNRKHQLSLYIVVFCFNHLSCRKDGRDECALVIADNKRRRRRKRNSLDSLCITYFSI